MSDEYLTIIWREPIGEDAQRLLEAGEWTFSSRSHVGRERDALRAENERLRAYNSDDLKSELWKLTVEARNLRIENKALRQDAERLDWLERVASLAKVELAKSLLHTGFEIGEWPSMRVTMRKGTLRDAIDAAMKEGER